MDEIWTPWRMPYIEADKTEEGCIFCRRPEEEEESGLILHRDPLTFTILNLYPYAVGHLMVIPYRHLSRMRGLTEPELEEIVLGLRRAEGVLRRVMGVSCFHAGANLGRPAGAGVAGHLHFHLVPGEHPPGEEGTEAGPPMPVEDTYALLAPAFAALR